MVLIDIPPDLETRFFVQSENALSDLPELLAAAFPGKTPFLIADENTWRAAGQKLERGLACCGRTWKKRIFPARPRLHPDCAISEELAGEFHAEQVPVAVGSGVINDLVKYASGLAGVRYCCVPTAASVDGYTSSGGAMLNCGIKMTMPCPAPYAILSDLAVLRAAPPEMLSGGYADLATKIPAGADWYIADAFGEEPIDWKVWDLVQKPLREYLRDPQDCGPVFAGLAATGYAMQMYGGSRPASGFEHLCSHVWEMEHLTFRGEAPSHGFQVGIGSLISLQLMEFVMDHSVAAARQLAAPPPTISEREREIFALLEHRDYAATVKKVAMAKFLSGEAILHRREEIWRQWESLREKLRRQLPEFAVFRARLQAAKCPVHPADIGLSREMFYHGVRTAQLIRNRYTIADLLFEAGLWETALPELEKLWE